MIVLVSSHVLAKDRLVLQLPDKAGPLVLSCDVMDYTADRISVHVNDQRELRQFPADEIAEVEAVQTEAHRNGVVRLNVGEIIEAERLFRQALEEEPRAWVRREILGWLVKCAMRRRDHVQAGSYFLQIIEDEPAPREYPLIPLVWGTAEVGTSLRQQARQWLTGPSDVGRLLGASILLLDASYGDVTRSELRRLARLSDRRISTLARAQLWRLRVTAPDVTENELAEWEREIASMPRELRAGPYYVLGRASFRRSEYDRAAAALLWLPTVYFENETLAAQATVDAGRSLAQLGRTSEARSLLEEVVKNADWSTAASEARSLLDQIPSDKDARRDG